MKTSIKGYRIYKPTRAGNGAAIQFNPSNDLDCVWIEMTPQIGERSFDFQGSKIVFKAGQNDLLQIVGVLDIVRSFQYKDMLHSQADFDKYVDSLPGELLNLFHKDERTGSVASFKISPNKHRYGGGFRISLYKKLKDGEARTFTIGVNPYEALGIIYAIEKCLRSDEPIPFDVE